MKLFLILELVNILAEDCQPPHSKCRSPNVPDGYLLGGCCSIVHEDQLICGRMLLLIGLCKKKLSVLDYKKLNSYIRGWLKLKKNYHWLLYENYIIIEKLYGSF